MIEDLERRLREMDRSLLKAETERETLNVRIVTLAEEIEVLGKNISIDHRAEEVLQKLSTKVLASSTKMIDKMVTAGLRITFEDRDLAFQSSTEKFRGRTAINFSILENGKPRPVADSHGGGILAVAGVLLRISTIILLDLRRILILDETLAHLSTAYIPSFSRLLKKVCQELDFKVLIVSHQQEFAEEADSHYLVKRVQGEVEFEKQNQGMDTNEKSNENSPRNG